jgi:hypothetical protein
MVQEIDRARACSIAAAVIRDEANAFAANEVQRVGEKHLDSRRDTGRSVGWPLLHRASTCAYGSEDGECE